MSRREERLQAKVQAMARRMGFLCWHNYDSRRYQPGFPDLVLIGRDLLIRELKVGDARLTKEQARYLDAFRRAGIDAGIWTDLDYYSGRIAREMDAAAPGWLEEAA